MLRTQPKNVISLHYPFFKPLKAALPIQSLLEHHRTACIAHIIPYTPKCAGNFSIKVLSVVPQLALLAADGSELRGKNPASMYSSVGKVRCSFAVAARWGSAAVASTIGAVVAVLVEEHAVEVDSLAVVGADLGGSVPEMVPRRNCCGLLAAANTMGVRSAVCCGCNMVWLDLP